MEQSLNGEDLYAILTLVAPNNGYNYNTYGRIIGGEERGVPDCALRLRKGAKTFDPDSSLDLTKRTGGLPSDGVIAGSGSTVWLRVYHEDEVSDPRRPTLRYTPMV